MTSSRSSSPSGSDTAGSSVATPLTPRSKVKALLAAVDTSSDEEPRPLKKKSSPSHTPKKARPVSRSTSSTESSEDEAAILRPRGKLAARMLARASSPQKTSPDATKDARERVRRMLLKEAEPEKPVTAGQPPRGGPMANNDSEDSDEDGVIAPRPRKLQQRRSGTKTPEADGPTTATSPASSIARGRSESPMFFSPAKAASPSARSTADDPDSDPDLPAISNPRFKALVAKKRQERLAREAEEARKKADRLAAQQAAADDGLISDDGDDSNLSDDEGGRRLTQEARPTRKASKKALEDISRETQRLTRSLQLAHEAKTKKKVTKAALFERFNFRPEGAAEPEMEKSSRPASPASMLHTDADMQDSDTPPSSPPVVGKPGDGEEAAPVEAGPDSLMLDDSNKNKDNGSDLPAPEAAIGVAREAAAEKRRQIKGKGKATEADLEEIPKPKRHFRVRLPTTHINTVALGSDDDDLDILPSKPKSRAQEILDRVPANKAKESRPMFVQRRLANLDDPDRKGSAPNGKRGGTKPSLTAAEHQVLLLQKARLQAKREREERLERLRAKGVHIQTEEERERERAQVEDIVAAARQEAEEIMLREREAAKKDKKERREAGEVDPLAWDDSDASDGTYQGDEDEKEGQAIELSGSEEDEDAEMGDEEAEEGDLARNALDDNAAKSGDESQDGESEGAEPSDDEEAVALPRLTGRRPKKNVAVISDDEESDQPGRVEATPKPKVAFFQSPSAPHPVSPKIPTSVLRSATKTFIPGLPVAGPAGLGLTQIFAGTMDDSQAGPLGASPSQLAPDFDAFPDSNFSQTAQEAPEDWILDSQAAETQAAETQYGKVNLHLSQSQAHGFDSLLRESDTNTQESDMLEPTQDGGFQELTPLKKRFVEPPQSTVDTLIPGEAEAVEHISESPLVQRAGKLRRRADLKAAAAAAAAASMSDDEDDTHMDGMEYDEFGFGTTSAFNLMKEAAAKEKKLKAKAESGFDKKKSKAREMIEEQAEESEDEYAGLGGADGEDSDNESNASVQEMIDNDTKLSKEDEAKMKAFYADRERASDEKQVEKLFRDITSGMLRRKRGADYDLSDSDDGGEARRRMKRRQFAKMQKALFADERISKVAENPRTQAFLRTIEDRGSDDEMDFLFGPTAGDGKDGAEDASSDSQSTEAPSTVPNSQPERQQQQQQQTARLPGPQRRTKMAKKPATIGDIRASLSNLLEEAIPSTSQAIPATASSDQSDSEPEDENEVDKENLRPPTDTNANANTATAGTNPRRRGRIAVVDRISLKRNASSNVSDASSTSTSRQAFANPSSASTFKVPALLRRATTNSAITQTSSSSSSSTLYSPSASSSITANPGQKLDAAGGDGGSGSGKLKRNAGKRSGINYFARENERRAALAESERRREARKRKGAEGRGKAVGGLFAAGKFE